MFRNLAITRLRDLMITAWKNGWDEEARRIEKLLSKYESMTEEQFNELQETA